MSSENTNFRQFKLYDFQLIGKRTIVPNCIEHGSTSPALCIVSVSRFGIVSTESSVLGLEQTETLMSNLVELHRYFLVAFSSLE